MASLPAPTTLSPGKLKLIYFTRGTRHEVGTNLRSDVDVTDIISLAGKAAALAPLVQDCCDDNVTITGWKITTPDNVSLYEANFVEPYVGDAGLSPDASPSDSASISFVGKGAPAVGLKQGQAKYTIFPGYFSVSEWAPPTQITTVIPGTGALHDFLDTDDMVGADFYGSKGNWKGYVNTQINAHFQKKLGM